MGTRGRLAVFGVCPGSGHLSPARTRMATARSACAWSVICVSRVPPTCTAPLPHVPAPTHASRAPLTRPHPHPRVLHLDPCMVRAMCSLRAAHYADLPPALYVPLTLCTTRHHPPSIVPPPLMYPALNLPLAEGLESTQAVSSKLHETQQPESSRMSSRPFDLTTTRLDARSTPAPSRLEV